MVGGGGWWWFTVNLAFCFGPKLWFWTWTKLNNCSELPNCSNQTRCSKHKIYGCLLSCYAAETNVWASPPCLTVKTNIRSGRKPNMKLWPSWFLFYELNIWHVREGVKNIRSGGSLMFMGYIQIQEFLYTILFVYFLGEERDFSSFLILMRWAYKNL